MTNRGIVAYCPPRAEIFYHGYDTEVAVKEDNINREPHKTRMNATAVAEQEPLYGCKAPAKHQPHKPCKKRSGMRGSYVQRLSFNCAYHVRTTSRPGWP